VLVNGTSTKVVCLELNLDIFRSGRHDLEHASSLSYNFGTYGNLSVNTMPKMHI
jgi:hypothetical protein